MTWTNPGAYYRINGVALSRKHKLTIMIDRFTTDFYQTLKNDLQSILLELLKISKKE